MGNRVMDILNLEEPSSRSSWLSRSVAQACCHRDQTVYGACFSERDWSWLEIVLPWSFRATKKFWARVIDKVECQGHRARANRLFVQSRPESTLKLWSSANTLLPTLAEVNVPRKTGIKGKCPFRVAADPVSDNEFLVKLLEGALKEQFGLVGSMAFDIDSLNAKASSLTCLHDGVSSANCRHLDPNYLWSVVDYVALITDKTSWTWIHRNYPSFCGLVRILASESSSAGTLVVKFEMLNDLRFLEEGNRGKPSLHIDWGELRMKLVGGHWTVLQLLIEDSYSLWHSAQSPN